MVTKGALFSIFVGVVVLAVGCAIFCFGRMSKITAEDRVRIDTMKRVERKIPEVMKILEAPKHLEGVYLCAMISDFGGVFSRACNFLQTEGAEFTDDIDEADYTIGIRARDGASNMLIIVITDPSGLVVKTIETTNAGFPEGDLLEWAKSVSMVKKREKIDEVIAEPSNTIHPPVTPMPDPQHDST